MVTGILCLVILALAAFILADSGTAGVVMKLRLFWRKAGAMVRRGVWGSEDKRSCRFCTDSHELDGLLRGDPELAVAIARVILSATNVWTEDDDQLYYNEALRLRRICRDRFSDSFPSNSLLMRSGKGIMVIRVIDMLNELLDKSAVHSL